jgi:hypothetical protein
LAKEYSDTKKQQMAKTAILEAKEEFLLDRKKAENYLLGVYLQIDISNSSTK